MPEADVATKPAILEHDAAQLARMWLLQDVPPQALEGLAAASEARRYMAGDTIVRQGEPSDGVYFLAAGAIDIYAASDEGVQRINRLDVGECFGEMGVIDGV